MFQTVSHSCDFCVVGGGMAGLCAAIAAARKGLRVVLMHERPVLGGNASSEIRMWICGAGGRDNRETGILEELALENLRINPQKKFALWDAVLYGAAKAQKNLTLLLNCSCMDGVCENESLKSVTGWQMTTQLFHRVEAPLFADCSGDSVLAPITNARIRYGREAADEFKERFGAVERDAKTMGASCLLQARETTRECRYIPPSFAARFNDGNVNNRVPDPKNYFENYWYIELGGDRGIGDSEEVRDELLKITYGLWDYVKNKKTGYESFELDWVGFLPGKRESRRYIGDVTVTQNDLEGDGDNYPDIVAFGGWPLDDHPPGGFYSAEPANRSVKTAMPYGISLRALYSENIKNLMFAGRNISASHAALTSARVMGTCAVMGQAVGTAAWIAVRDSVGPRGVYENAMDELRSTLMYDDCYIPFARMDVGVLTKSAELVGTNPENLENLRNGLDRPRDGSDNGWHCEKGGYFEYRFKTPEYIKELRLVFDSDLNRGMKTERGKTDADEYDRDALSASEFRHATKSNTLLSEREVFLPGFLVRDFRVEAFDETSRPVFALDHTDNARRLVIIKIEKPAAALRVTLERTYGFYPIHIFSATLR